MKIYFLLITLLMIQKIHNYNENDSLTDYKTTETDSEKIEDAKIEELHEAYKKIYKCNKNILIAYGLTGEDEPKMLTNKFCPNIHQNCCTPEDNIKSYDSWKNLYKPALETYYNTYLIALRYILGFLNQVTILANEFEFSTIDKCKKAAESHLAMNISDNYAKTIYEEFVNSIHKVSEIRKRFSCIMCDAENQTSLTDYWSSENRNENKIYLGKNFCSNIVRDTISSSFHRIIYFHHYMDNLSALIDCKKGGLGENLHTGLDEETISTVKSCKYYMDNDLFFNCERYCENFHLTKPSKIIEGDIESLKKVFFLIKEERKKFFLNSDNNFLSDNVEFDEEFVAKKYETENFNNYTFFKSHNQEISLDKYITDIVYFGGIEPYSENSKSPQNDIFLYVEAIESTFIYVLKLFAFLFLFY